MHSLSTTGPLLLALATSTVARARTHRTRDDSTVYSPVSPSILAGYETRTGGTHPSAADYNVVQGLSTTMNLVAAEYGLRDYESFYWGVDENPLANLTAYTDGEEVRVLSLERFDDILQTVDCTNTSIAFTFAQEVDFQAVQNAWSWVNDATDNYIVFVTESTQCNASDGDDTDRQPWHITQIGFDDSGNVATLTAEPKTWAEAFSSWQIVVDSAGIVPVSAQRRFGMTVQERAIFTPSLDLSKDFSGASIPFGGGQGALREIGGIVCTNCGTTGGLDFTLTINCDLTGSIKITTRDVKAYFGVEVDLIAGPHFDYSQTLLSWQPPNGAGKVVIVGIIDLGPTVSVDITGTIWPLQADFTIETGMNVSIPTSSFVEWDWSTGHANEDGWTPMFTPAVTRFSGSINVAASVGPQLRLGFAGSLLGSAGAEIGFLLTAPILTLNATAFEKAEASSYSCPTPVDPAGVSLEVDVGMAVKAYETLTASRNLFFVTYHTTKATSQTLYATSSALYSTCILSTLSPTVPLGTYSKGSKGTGDSAPGGGNLSPESAPYGSAPCPVHGQLVCNGVGYFALCNWGTAIWQQVAQGTTCENGQIVGTGIYTNPTALSDTDSNSIGSSSPGDCPNNGQLLCHPSDPNQYGLCNWDRIIWQPVADGMHCQSGQIIETGQYAISGVTATSVVSPSMTSSFTTITSAPLGSRQA